MGFISIKKMRLLTDTHCNKRRRKGTRSENGKEQEAIHPVEKKKNVKEDERKVRRKEERENMCDTIKKSVKKERRQIVQAEKYEWRPDGRRSRRYRDEEEGKRGRAGWERGPEEKEQVGKGGCERSRGGVTS